ncbi:hypothetical protein TRAPUB_1445 [Trametes pubescens]|uniref:t-SNARE coiled-coil homology domain-containing protein n=1 Tax=Trametes pubescens TaxID=154538 RepID=A0A1M2VJB5_TRAPU|nr:hypothetical protein TRAPUB_1445 [Trametes pubescens]
MSSSRDRVEDTYELQNDQRLDELHSKLRTLRGVTTDIYDDVERQNSALDTAVSAQPVVSISSLLNAGVPLSSATLSHHLERLLHNHHDGPVKHSA